MSRRDKAAMLTATYPLTKISGYLAPLRADGKDILEYVNDCEGEEIWDYLAEVWKVMKAAVERGIEAEGVLPGGLCGGARL